MKLEINRLDIERMLDGLRGILAHGNKNIPILDRILIEASDKTVALTVTDMETILKISGTANVYREGVALPPGKNLIKVIDALKDNEFVDIETVKNRVLITGEERASFKLPDASPDDYPDIKLQDSISFTEVRREDLLRVIDKATYAVDSNSYNPAFTGIHLEGLKDEMRCVATNGMRMAITKSAMEGNLDISDKGIIIPAGGAKEIVRLLRRHSDCETVDIGFDSETMVVKSMSSFDNTVLTIRLLDGEFPDYKRVISRNNGMSFVADREALVSSLKRVRIVAKDAPDCQTLLMGDGNKLVVQSQNGAGYVSDEIELDDNMPEPFRFSINASYLLDAVKTITAKDVCISKTDGMISVNGDGNTLNVVAGLRS